MEITVEISASTKDGFPDHKARIVTENARTLKFDSYGLEVTQALPTVFPLCHRGRRGAQAS